jgi:hypothetical protein
MDIDTVIGIERDVKNACFLGDLFGLLVGNVAHFRQNRFQG